MFNIIKPVRMIFYFMTAALSVLIFTTGVFSQSDSAYIPFVVNVNAKVLAWQGVDTARIGVEANKAETLAVYLGSSVSVAHGGARMRADAPVLKSDSRGNITLRLPQESYQSVEISLYSVSGKRIFSHKADVGASVRNISLSNVASGVYVVSVRGIKGGSFSNRITHRGGKLNICVEFGTVSTLMKEAYGTAQNANANANAWTISVTAAGYDDSIYTFVPVRGVNATQNITLRKSRHGSFIDTRDEKSYKTVLMPDGKIWMAENLNYDTLDGIGSWCYNNSPDSCAKYGRLYNWSTALVACPEGWKLPDTADWDALIRVVGSSRAGTRLKSKTGWNTGSGYIAGTDDHGFSALPGGSRGTDGRFWYVGDGGHWWSASEAGGSYAHNRGMDYNREGVISYWTPKGNGSSVRCLMN